MCISPVLIRNPNDSHNGTYFGKMIYERYSKEVSEGKRLPFDDSPYIYVPCGHCPQCVATKQMYILQRFQMETLESYVFFATLTYDDVHLPVCDVNDFSIPYANFKYFTDMVKRIRRKNMFGRPFSYFAVSERGTEKGRPHHHALFFLPKFSTDNCYTPFNLESQLYDVLFNQWALNVGSKWHPVYEPLFTFHAIVKDGKVFKNFDLHYVQPLQGYVQQESVCFYVMKYMLKDSKRERSLQQALKLNLSPEDYNMYWNVLKSRCQFSKHFGLGQTDDSIPSDIVYSHLRNGIDSTPVNSPFLYFNDVVSGKCLPLARYYRENANIIKYDDLFRVQRNLPKEFFYSSLPEDFINYSKSRFEQYEKRLSMSQAGNNPILTY